MFHTSLRQLAKCRVMNTRQVCKMSSSILSQIPSIASIPASARRVCIVGTGPSAFYTAKYQLNQDPECYIHMIEKLPVPFGLVRHGIAPDHPEAKAVMNDFTSNVLNNPRVEFMGNISMGEDISLETLQKAYQVVILAIGATEGKVQNIPHEELSFDARELVMWYNGDPYTPQPCFDLKSTESVVIIGNGNVSLDIARILLLPNDMWKNTDVPQNVREELQNNNVSHVHIVARKNVTGAAWTIAEQREIQTLLKDKEDYEIIVHNGYVEENDLKMKERPIKRKTDLLISNENITYRKDHIYNQENDDKKTSKKKKYLHLHFNCLPTSMTSTGVIVQSEEHLLNIPNKQNTVIMKSIGSTVRPADGITLSSRGTIATTNGRMRENVYAVGWANRGSVGIVGTHIGEANDLVAELLKVLPTIETPLYTVESVWEQIEKDIVTKSQWKHIHEAEIELGREHGQMQKETYLGDIKLNTIEAQQQARRHRINS